MRENARKNSSGAHEKYTEKNVPTTQKVLFAPAYHEYLKYPDIIGHHTRETRETNMFLYVGKAGGLTPGGGELMPRKCH